MSNLSKNEYLAFYANTSFDSEINGVQFSIRAGEIPEKLNAYLLKINCKSWAFLTAANPHSKVLSVLENISRNEELEAALIKLRLSFYEGVGRSLNGSCESEESYLVLGISFEQAMDLSKRFEQNAFVFAQVNQPAELVWSAD